MNNNTYKEVTFDDPFTVIGHKRGDLIYLQEIDDTPKEQDKDIEQLTEQFFNSHKKNL